MARWLKVSVCLIGIVGLALATLPFWLGGPLGLVLRANGITFERYERAGYARFELHEARFQSADVDVTAKKVQAPTPLVWLQQRMRGTKPILLVDGWRLRILENPEQTPDVATIRGLPDLTALVQRISPQIFHWLPRATLSDGELLGVGPDIAIDRVDWQDSTLKVEGLRVSDRVLSFDLTPDADDAIVLNAHTVDNVARLRLRMSGAEVTGEGSFWDQTVQLSARYAETGWMPVEASAIAEGWRLPAARVKLGAPYATVAGDARLIWRNDSFELSANAKAEPEADTRAPPFEARAVASGNLREITVTEFHIDAPFATADLSAPITFKFDGPVSAQSARLFVKADLGQLPWLEARGTVEGSVVVIGSDTTARQEFELKFNEVAVRDFKVDSADVAGVLQWPRMELSRLNAQLDETSSLEAHGSVNWATRELDDVAVNATLGAEWFARWLPAGAGWTTAELVATAKGSLDAPKHAGTLKFTGAQWPPLHPITIDASWEGAGSSLEVAGLATADDSTVAIAGTLDPRGLLLTKLDFAAATQPVWQLAAPASIAWSPQWQVDDLRLSGSVSELALKMSGGADGSVELTASNFESAWLQDWVTLTGPGWTLHTATATGRIDEGTLVFDAAITAQIEMSPSPAHVSVTAHGDAGGIELREFKVAENERVLTQATGQLPVSWVTAPEPHLRVDETAPFELNATTEPDSPLWASLAAWSGLELDAPAAKVNLQGTLRQLEGEVTIGASRLVAAPGRFKFPFPDLEDLDLALQFDRERVTLTNFSAKLDGQAVQATGQMPMDDDRWQQLWRDPANFDWSKAQARVEIPDADLAPLSRRFPDLVAAQGRLVAHVELAPGAKFTGELRLTDAATRPLAPFGTVQDINAEIVLAGDLLTVRSMTATLGGEAVTLGGSVTLVSGGAPRLDLKLAGKNLPLVRNTGLLLRSDLDIAATTDAAGLTRLSGTVTVRDCLVLANLNLRTLLPTGRRGVTRHPPYFAVEAEPFSHWPLAIEVIAAGTVRVRTTVYNGTTSAQFSLGGTLGEPRAVGALTVDSGRVLFPFATFTVQHGAVRLREANPFVAEVNLGATSQRRDYQLRLEMTGELPEPNVVITSAPAMAAADVLLLVMTGQLPAGATGTASGNQRLALLGAYLGRGFFTDLGLGGGDRLEISAGEHVSRQGRETYEFEYKLGERWSLIGEYDAYDAYNAGLKWRFYTQEGEPLEKK
jgi:translocation and assembly module TamB